MSYNAARLIPMMILFILGIYENFDLVKTINIVTTDIKIYSGLSLFFLSLILFRALPPFISVPLAISVIWHDLGKIFPLSEFFKVSSVVGFNAASAFLMIRPYFSNIGASLLILTTIWLTILKTFFLSYFGIFTISADLSLSILVTLLASISLFWRGYPLKHIFPSFFRARLSHFGSWNFSLLATVSICLFYLVYNFNLSGDAVKFYFFFPSLVADSGQLRHPFMGESMYQYMPKAFELLLAHGILYGGILGGKTIQFLIIIGFIAAFREFFSQQIGLRNILQNMLIILLFSMSQLFTYIDRSSPDILLLLVNMLLLNLAHSRALALIASVLILGLTTKYTFIFVIFGLIIIELFEHFLKNNHYPTKSVTSFIISSKSVLFLAIIAIVPAYFYLEAFVNTGSIFQNNSGAHVSTLFPSPYRSGLDLFTFLTHAYVETSKYSEVYPFAYGILGFCIIPALFLINIRHSILNIPLIFFAVQLIFTSQTRYLYSVIPMIFLNVVTSLNKTKITNNKIIVSCIMIFLAILSTTCWPNNIKYNPNILSFLGFRHDVIAEGDYSNIAFQIEVNKIITQPSRSFVSNWDYNLHTNTIPYKEVITSVFRLRDIIGQQNLWSSRLFMIWFPIESEPLLGGNSFIARCISKKVDSIPFDFMPGQNLTIYEIDLGKLDSVAQTLYRAGFSQKDNLFHYDKNIRDSLLLNFDESSCQSVATMTSLFLKH